MRPPAYVYAVMALRRRKEECEERMLADIHRDIRRETSDLERLDNQLGLIGEARRSQPTYLACGVDHHRLDSTYRELLQHRAEVLSRIQGLIERRTRQMNQYLAARREREVISDLEQRRTRAHKAEMTSRETRQSEDLFLARFGRT